MKALPLLAWYGHRLPGELVVLVVAEDAGAGILDDVVQPGGLQPAVEGGGVGDCVRGAPHTDHYWHSTPKHIKAKKLCSSFSSSAHSTGFMVFMSSCSSFPPAFPFFFFYICVKAATKFCFSDSFQGYLADKNLPLPLSGEKR